MVPVVVSCIGQPRSVAMRPAARLKLDRAAVAVPQAGQLPTFVGERGCPVASDELVKWIRASLNPCHHADVAANATDICADIDIVIHAVKTERQPDLARRKGRAVLQRPVVTVLNVIGIPISRPPADHVRGRGDALWLALACAACIVDRLNFGSRERAVEDFHFVHKSWQIIEVSSIQITENANAKIFAIICHSAAGWRRVNQHTVDI